MKVLVRSHPFLHLKKPGPSGQHTVRQPVIVRAKLEYHPIENEQGELTTNAELAHWWLASEIASGSQVWVSQLSGGPSTLLLSEAFEIPPMLHWRARDDLLCILLLFNIFGFIKPHHCYSAGLP